MSYIGFGCVDSNGIIQCKCEGCWYQSTPTLCRHFRDDNGYIHKETNEE